jgi:shikimate kinase
MATELRRLGGQSISLVGLMGVGKTTIGRRLANRLGMPFYDSDDEIEKASGRTVKGYFNDYGETEFRNGERRVIRRLLANDPIILGTGGGAFIPKETRAVLSSGSLTVWLKADFDVNMERVNRKVNKRPLLDVDDPEAAMRALVDVRYPLYAKADICVKAGSCSHAATVTKVIKAIENYYDA